MLRMLQLKAKDRVVGSCVDSTACSVFRWLKQGASVLGCGARRGFGLTMIFRLVAGAVGLRLVLLQTEVGVWRTMRGAACGLSWCSSRVAMRGVAWEEYMFCGNPRFMGKMATCIRGAVCGLWWRNQRAIVAGRERKFENLCSYTAALVLQGDECT